MRQARQLLAANSSVHRPVSPPEHRVPATLPLLWPAHLHMHVLVPSSHPDIVRED